MNEPEIDLDQTDEETLTDEVSDEALEIAAGNIMQRISFPGPTGGPFGFCC